MTAEEKLEAFQELLKEGMVAIRIQHNHGCCTYFTAIHPCDCGAMGKYREAIKLVHGEKSKEVKDYMD